MRKPIRITESDLQRMVENSVKRALKEEAIDEGLKDWGRTAALGAGLGAAAAGVVGTDNHISRGLDRQFADQEEVGRAFPEDRAEFGDELGPQKTLSPDTISWEKANGIGEGRINRAITESIRRFINELSTDTRDEARKKAFRNFTKNSEKYGNADPRTQHAKDQYNTFANSYEQEYYKGNTAKKARMDKNREDRESGKRTYVKGKGWRTQQGEQ